MNETWIKDEEFYAKYLFKLKLARWVALQCLRRRDYNLDNPKDLFTLNVVDPWQ